MNPCITIDVSKESSHVQGFLDFDTPISKPKKFFHTKEGFSTIMTIYNIIILKTGINPKVYFEYTGVYHKTLMAYLKANNINTENAGQITLFQEETEEQNTDKYKTNHSFKNKTIIEKILYQ